MVPFQESSVARVPSTQKSDTGRNSKPRRRFFGALLLVAGIGLQSGCSLLPWVDKDKPDMTQDINTTEQVLYRNIQRAMRAGNYNQAIEDLERMEAMFPFGRYAEQAQLEIVYAQFMSADLDGARASADRFIRLHPSHANIDYAYYLKGLAAFNKNRGLLDRIFAANRSRRDITHAQNAYADFAQLLARFPNSQYAPDSKQRMLFLRNLMAESEMQIADYYMRRGAYIAASNRARFVVENYSKSYAVDDALAVLVEASWKLGLEESADDALRVLAANYPEYPAFDGEGNLILTEQVRNRDRSWTNMITFGLLDRPEVPPPLRIKQTETPVAPENI